jgi:hypothetical protein
MPRKITAVEAFQTDAALRDLLGRLRRGDTGSLRATDPESGRPATFLFAPVPSAGWSLVVVSGD